MPRQYKFAQPDVRVPYYKEHDLVNFTIPTIPGAAVVPGSVVMSADLQVRTGVVNYGSTPTGTLKTDDVQISFDSMAGVSCLVGSLSSATQQGTLDNIYDYPRFVKAYKLSTQFNEANMANDLYQSSQAQMGEDDFVDHTLSKMSAADGLIPIQHRPVCSLTTCSAPISMDKYGSLKISMTLNSVQKALFGPDNASTVGYWLSNIVLHYEVVPDTGFPDPMFQRFQTSRFNVNSAQVSINENIPGLSNSFLCSFLLASDETSYTVNCYKCAVVPSVDRVSFSLSGADNVKVGFPIESNEYIEKLAQSALGVPGQNSLRLSKQQKKNAENDGYLIGLNFGQLWNLSNNAFSLILNSDLNYGADNDLSRYIGYTVFRSIGKL